MSVITIIPARYGSTRLPGKALLAETGWPLIRHVVESVSSARRPGRVVVATDDQRVLDAVAAFGGQAILTRESCRTGSDRLADAADRLGLTDDDVVVNVQGDEPQMPGWCVDRVVELLDADPEAAMATLATPITPEEAELPQMTKVVFGQPKGSRPARALYFSRAKVPADRDRAGTVQYYLHHGIYAYRVGFLRTYAGLPSTPAEDAEKLEQLRALEHGYAIAVDVVEYRGARIDTPGEYQAFVKAVQNR